MLLACGKSSNSLTNNMVSATFQQLITCIGVEQDSSFLASLYKCFADSMIVIGGPNTIDQEIQAGVMDVTKRQLQSMADKRKARAKPGAGMGFNGDIGGLDVDDKEGMALVEEMEDFALEDMSRMLQNFDPNHPLLVAVSSVRDLGFNDWDNEDEDD